MCLVCDTLKKALAEAPDEKRREYWRKEIETHNEVHRIREGKDVPDAQGLVAKLWPGSKQAS